MLGQLVQARDPPRKIEGGQACQMSDGAGAGRYVAWPRERQAELERFVEARRVKEIRRLREQQRWRPGQDDGRRRGPSRQLARSAREKLFDARIPHAAEDGQKNGAESAHLECLA